ncbi:Zn-dependent hydrolase [Niallia sp. BSM11]|uniref:Zn-dependent hydrolase n=1 Tax=Niallia sp. BSM11 TaxID=3391576 RepID=UPI0039852ECA
MDTTAASRLDELLLSDYDHTLDHGGISGKRIAQRLYELSKIGLTDENGSYRIGFSAEEKLAKQLVANWMTEAGLSVKQDEAGNIIGRLAGNDEELPAILSGSHVDSVPNGGHFDGPLGVLAALEVVEAWRETGFKPTHPYEVIIFSDEEGARFNGGLTGSRAMTGDIDVENQLSLVDSEGANFQTVIENNGLSLDTFFQAKRDLSKIKAYVEVHIEQGKRLEKENLPVGIVSGIAGPSWLKITLSGEAGHAGNTPMDDRKDALVAAGELLAAIPALPKMVSSTAVATVGKLHVHPNGVNVIPGRVELFVDIRDIYEDKVDALVALTIEKAAAISESYGIKTTFEQTLKVSPMLVQDDIKELLEQSLQKMAIKPYFLPSGAGHDAMVLGRHVPSAMIFARSRKGISHNPEEWTTLSDCVQSVHVLKNMIESLDEN